MKKTCHELSEMIRDFIRLKNVYFSNKSTRGVFMKFSLRPLQTTWPHQWPSVLLLHVVLRPVSGTRTGGAAETTWRNNRWVGWRVGEKVEKEIMPKGSRRILRMLL